MKAIQQLSPAEESVLNKYREIGGVIDHVLINGEGALGSTEEAHREAAILTLDTLQKKREQEVGEHVSKDSLFMQYKDCKSIDEALKTFGNKDLIISIKEEGKDVVVEFKNEHKDPGTYWHMTYKTDGMTGERITMEQFLGPYFDIKTKHLFARGRHRDFLNDYFRAGEEESKKNIVFSAGTSPQHEGYAYSFSEPPYSVRIHGIELQQLFDEMVKTVLGDLPSDAVIYRWNTDCSNYFDAGKEWWGSFFWTLYLPDGRFVGIAASTTD